MKSSEISILAEDKAGWPKKQKSKIRKTAESKGEVTCDEAVQYHRPRDFIL